MILTLTANPSLDRTLEIAQLERGAVLRATATRVDPGGKGVNVARALAANGTPARAVLPCGGAEGLQVAGLLANVVDLEVITVPVTGSVRANVTVAEPDGTTTKLNEPGPELTAEELKALADTLVLAAANTEWVVLSGSLPPGAPADLYASLIARLHDAGARVAIDSSGVALAHALVAGPDLVKPNREELAAVTGREVGDLGAVVEAAVRVQELAAARHRAPAEPLRLEPATVLVSLGAAGALLVDGSGAAGARHAGARPILPRSTVGAGDAALAGFLHAGARGAAALAEAVAWGTAAASLPGSRPPGPADIDRLSVHVHTAVDHWRRLEEDRHAAHLA
jgi:1-phosphofructokinase